jgi:hypothetical protein
LRIAISRLKIEKRKENLRGEIMRMKLKNER